MKKWIGPGAALLLVTLFLSFYSPFGGAKSTPSEKDLVNDYRIVPLQGEKKEENSSSGGVLRVIQETLNSWLKLLNERIESEDITRFEVRFLEILRNVLEWMKDRVDARIESSKAKEQEKRNKGKGLRDTRQRFSPVPPSA